MKANADWDVGMTGATPALLGAKEFNIVTVGIAADISRTNVLMARQSFVDKVTASKVIPKGSRFALTLGSTVDYAAQTCLALWGGNSTSDMVVKGGSQAEVIKAGADGEADIVGLWTPHIYTMQEKHGFVPFCTGKDFSPGIFGAIVARRDYALANQQAVAKFLAVISRSANWILANPEKAQALHISTAAEDKITVSSSAAKNDFAKHAVFNLKQQLDAMGSSSGGVNDSQAGRSFFSINIFLNEGKQGSRTLKPASFMDASYLKLANDDPVLAKMASKN
jgi:NitT/TauT family transport system substrate-binding protein